MQCACEQLIVTLLCIKSTTNRQTSQQLAQLVCARACVRLNEHTAAKHQSDHNIFLPPTIRHESNLASKIP